MVSSHRRNGLRRGLKKRIYRVEVNGVGRKVRARRRWRNGVT